MTPHRLRWLTLISPLGLLGLLLKNPLFFVLFGFAVFSVFLLSRPDERAERNLGRAACVAYLATLTAIVLVYLWLGIFIVHAGLTRADLVARLSYAIVAITLAHILAFTTSYSLFDLRGD